MTWNARKWKVGAEVAKGTTVQKMLPSRPCCVLTKVTWGYVDEVSSNLVTADSVVVHSVGLSTRALFDVPSGAAMRVVASASLVGGGEGL